MDYIVKQSIHLQTTNKPDISLTQVENYLLDLSSDAESWHQVFDMMGTISVKAEETTNAPALEHENYDPSTKEYTAQCR